jgi:hypothetical protein
MIIRPKITTFLSLEEENSIDIIFDSSSKVYFQGSLHRILGGQCRGVPSP